MLNHIKFGYRAIKQHLSSVGAVCLCDHRELFHVGRTVAKLIDLTVCACVSEYVCESVCE